MTAPCSYLNAHGEHLCTAPVPDVGELCEDHVHLSLAHTGPVVRGRHAGPSPDLYDRLAAAPRADLMVAAGRVWTWALDQPEGFVRTEDVRDQVYAVLAIALGGREAEVPADERYRWRAAGRAS